jgi:uncharacterized membrane protein
LRHGTIIGRIGFILLLTGIVIALVSQFRDFNRLSSNMVSHIWAGLVAVGAVLLIVFIIDLALRKQNNQRLS